MADAPIESTYQQNYKTVLFYGDLGGDGDPAMALAGIKEWGELPGSENGEIDVSRTDDASAVKTFVAEKRVDPGSIGFTLGFMASQLTTMASIQGVSKRWMIKFQDGTKLVGQGFLKSTKPKANANGEFTVDGSIRCSGAWVATPPTA